MTLDAVLPHRPRHIRKPSPHEMFSFPPVLPLLLLNSTQPTKPLRNVTPKRRAHIGHLSAVRRPRGEGPALRGLWRERRRGGRPLRPLPDARRQPGGLAAHQGHLSGKSLLPPGHTFYQLYHLVTPVTNWSHLPVHLGQGGERRALLRLGRQRRVGPLRQDGPQRHRVWRHAGKELRDFGSDISYLWFCGNRI